MSPLQFRDAVKAMAGYQPGEQPQVGKIIKLNTNENPFPPSSAVMAALDTVTAEQLRRYPDPLATAFRTVAADLLDVDPDWIICGNGSDDMLTVLVRAFVGEGQALQVASPSYSLYITLANIQGATVNEVAYRPDWTLPEQFYSPPSDVRLAFVANPNSPSGTLVPMEKIQQMAEQWDGVIVVDEAYGDFSPTTCLPLVKTWPNVIVTRSLSKSYGLAGIRFGFAVAQPAVVEQLMKVKDSYNVDAISVAAATAAINDQSWLEDNLRLVLCGRERLTRELTQLGFSVQPSHANFVWCTHQRWSSLEIYQRLKQSGILVRYMKYDGWGDGLRISVGTDEQISACVAVLHDICQ